MSYIQLVAWMLFYIAFGFVFGWSYGYRRGHKDGYQRGKAISRHATVRVLPKDVKWIESTTHTGSVE